MTENQNGGTTHTVGFTPKDLLGWSPPSASFVAILDLGVGAEMFFPLHRCRSRALPHLGTDAGGICSLRQEQHNKITSCTSPATDIIDAVTAHTARRGHLFN